MRIRLHTARLLLAAMLPAAALLQSCVGDTAMPEAEPGSWIDVPIPQIIRMDANALVADGHGTLFMGGDRRTPLWRSTDRGVTWIQKTAGLNTSATTAALVVKGGETVFAALPGAGVFVSRNHGESWIQINNHLTDLGVQALAVAADGSIIAGTSNGRIFRSSNDGGVWVQVQGAPIDSYVTELVADTAGIIYAGSLGQGVFYSADNGLTWTPSSDGLASLDIVALAIDRQGRVLAGAWASGIYRSAGAGAPWERIDGGAIPRNVNAIALDESGAIFAGTSAGGVFRSHDGGDSWEPGDVGLRGLYVKSLLCVNDVILAGTSDEGAFRSTDEGASWSPPRSYNPNPSISFDESRTLLVDSCGTYYLFTHLTFYRSRDRGETWIGARPATYAYLYCLAIHPNSSLLAGTGDGIWISRDSGYSWSVADTSSAGRIGVAALEVAANGTVFGWTNEGILRFSDGCSSWERVFDGSDVAGISTGSAGCVYLGTRTGGVFGSSDNGDTWRRMTDSLWVNEIEADRVGNVFALVKDGILCSNDEGETWHMIELTVKASGPTASNRAYKCNLVAAPGGELTVFYDDGGTLYLSEDHLSTWRTEAAPYDEAALFLSPSGFLFISESNPSGLHRSRNSLF